MGVTRERSEKERELLASARQLIPALKERAEQADRDMKVPVETVADMREAGLFRAMQPKRFGGFEMDPRGFFEIQQALAEGCMSTAWIYGVMGVHPWQLARFDVRSEERRVGKECRAWWLAGHYIMKWTSAAVDV